MGKPCPKVRNFFAFGGFVIGSSKIGLMGNSFSLIKFTTLANIRNSSASFYNHMITHAKANPVSKSGPLVMKWRRNPVK